MISSEKIEPGRVEAVVRFRFTSRNSCINLLTPHSTDNWQVLVVTYSRRVGPGWYDAA
jgi:hypothetical protein